MSESRADPPARSDKHAQRRRELAEAALETLLERGFANTSLRDIAENSAFTHGIMHYYFEGKLDLIVTCLDYYEDRLRRRPAGPMPDTPDAFAAYFAASVHETLVDHATVHRLWYDIRAQALYEESLQSPVARVEEGRAQLVSSALRYYARLRRAELLMDATLAYPMIDGLFQTALHERARGGTSRDIAAQVVGVMEMFVGGAA